MTFLLILLLFLLLAIVAKSSRTKSRLVEVQIRELFLRLDLLERQIHNLLSRSTPASSPQALPAVAPATPAPALPPPRRDLVSPPTPQPPVEPVYIPGPTVEVPDAVATPVSGRRAFATLLGFEEALGTNWLNKLGIVSLVFGVAFFLAYQMRRVGPEGKLSVACLVCVVLIAGGAWLERRQSFRIFARALIGGGWALAFFTAYAMYYLPTVRVFHAQAPDLLLMLLVGAAMVVHSLRYESQVVTGLAFLLSFSTLPISQVPSYGIAAGAVLTAGLVIVTARRKWVELEIVGIIAAYASQAVWVHRLLALQKWPDASASPFGSAWAASVVLLLTYWALFRAAYLVRRCNPRQEKLAALAALLNSVGLLAVLQYQSVNANWSFWTLAGLGVAELALSRLARRRDRPMAFEVLSVIGVTLLAASIPCRFQGAPLETTWLIGAEALLAIGISAGETIYLRLGLLGTLLTPILLITQRSPLLFDLRHDHPGALQATDLWLAGLAALAAAFYLANSRYLPRRWPALFGQNAERTVLPPLTYGAAGLVLVAIWAAVPYPFTAWAWAAAAGVCVQAGSAWRWRELRYSGHALLGLAGVAAVLLILPDAAHAPAPGMGAAIVAGIAAVAYGASRWPMRPVAAEPWPAFYRWVGTILLGLAAAYTLASDAVAPAFVALGLVLFELGWKGATTAADGTISGGARDLRMQAYALLTAGFAVLYLVNLNSLPGPGYVDALLYTSLPVAAALYYAYWRLQREGGAATTGEAVQGANIAAWLGALSLLGLLRFELMPEWVAVGWAVVALAALALAWRWRSPMLVSHSILFAFCASLRASVFNLPERHPVSAAWVIGPLFAGLWFGLAIGRRFRVEAEPAEVQTASPPAWGRRIARGLLHHPEQVFFWLPLALLTALLALETRHGMVSVSWSILGVIVFLSVLRLGQRSFRLAGIGLILLAAVKVTLLDAWRLAAGDRALVFLTLGAALLLVSFLYSRFREQLRKYL